MNLSDLSGERMLEFMKPLYHVRAAGTPEEADAAQGIINSLYTSSDTVREGSGSASMAAVSASVEPFSFPSYRITSAALTANGISYPVAGYAFSGLTPEKGITAPLLYAENADPISLKRASGCIVMVNQPVRKDLHDRLKSAGAVGFIALAGTLADPLADTRPFPRTLFGTYEAPLPGLVMHVTAALELLKRDPDLVTMTLCYESVQDASQNVIATIPGTDPALSQEVITLTAHYDSVPQGPGAYDNLAACAMIWELYHFFMTHPCKRTLEFVWFGCEERGLFGSRAYAEAHKDHLKDHILNLNIDLAGQHFGGNVFGVTADASVGTYLEQIAEQAGIGVTIKHQVWSSDSNTFAAHNVPAVTLNRDGIGMHTSQDTLDLISPWSLERSAFLLGSVIEDLGDRKELPFCSDIPEAFQEMLHR